MLRYSEPKAGETKALPFALYALTQYEEACRLVVLEHLASNASCGPASSHTSKISSDAIGRRKIRVETLLISDAAVDLSEAANMLKRVIGEDQLVNGCLKDLVRNKVIGNEVDILRRKAADAMRDMNRALVSGQDVSGLKGQPESSDLPENWIRFTPIDETVIEQCMRTIFRLVESLLYALRTLFSTNGKGSRTWSLHGCNRYRKGDLAYKSEGDVTSKNTVALEVKKWGSNSITKMVKLVERNLEITGWSSTEAIMQRVRENVVNALKKIGKTKRRPRVEDIGPTQILHQIIAYGLEESARGFISLTDFINGWVEMECKGTDPRGKTLFDLRFWPFAQASDSLPTIDEEAEEGDDNEQLPRPTGTWYNEGGDSEDEVENDVWPTFIPGQLKHPYSSQLAQKLDTYDMITSNVSYIELLGRTDYVGWKPSYDYVSIGSQIGFQAFKFADMRAMGGFSMVKHDTNRPSSLDSSYLRTSAGADPIIYDNAFWIPHELNFTQISSFCRKVASYTVPFLFTIFKPDFIVSGEEEDVTLVVNRTSHRRPLFHAPVTTTIPTRQGFILFALYSTIVIKVFYYQEHYEKELQVYSDMKGCPGILPLLATGIAPSGNRFIVLPYVGETVTEISDADARYIYDNALKYMHAKQYHHHDIHTENVLRDPYGRLYLIDFSDVERSCTYRSYGCFDQEWMMNHAIQEEN
ncbi:hypothetical protein D9611_008146 [Ephemerocybe angulata]|uniref:Protein kinase domain-containing protein n=1 Tax=Ephemerocybe angulata TaxID=980116 RepID=A0A8H5FD72_9AGAR|nr:hypothetical protein D9611_008146 [Tulosesus angulatus]